MQRYSLHRRMLATSSLILGLAIASCQSPTSPADRFTLSASELVFSDQEQEPVSIRNLASEPLEWRIEGSTASWLNGAPASGRVEPHGTGSLVVRILRAAVPEGNHTATLRIGAGGQSRFLKVSVQPRSAAASLVPNQVSFGTTGVSAVVDVVNSGGSVLNWRLNGPSWLTISPSSGSLDPGATHHVTLTTLRSGLAEGHTQGSLRLTWNGGSASTTVSLDVEDASLRLVPGTLNFGPSATKMSFSIVNNGDTAIDWSADPSTGWISLSPDSGRLPPKLSQLLTVDITRANLFHGTNQGAIQFSSNGGSPSMIVNAIITPAGGSNPAPTTAPRLSIAPVRLDFGATNTELQLIIQNEGDQALDWSGDPQGAWISLPTASGRVAPHSHSTVPVRISRSNLSPGAYQSFIQFESNGGSVVTTVAAVVNSPGAPSPPPSTPTPKLLLTPSSLDYGVDRVQLNFRIENTGTASLQWSAQAAHGWLSLNTSSGNVAAGTGQNVTVTASRSQIPAAGDYSSTIQLTSNGGGATLPVLLEVAPPDGPPPPPPPSGGTVNVRDYGAVGNGVHDDSGAFATALAALGSSSGTLYVPAGTYLVRPHPVARNPQRAIDLENRSNITIRGDGMDASFIRLSAGSYEGDVHILFMENSSGIVIEDLTFDGNKRNSTWNDQQKHCVEVWWSRNIRFERVRFDDCIGDGIRLLGQTGGSAWVDTVRVLRSVFEDCGRSGITVQRAVRNLEVLENTFTRISDQSIDFEPTGATAPSDIDIVRNTFNHFTVPQTVTLAGIDDSDRAARINFTDNVLNGGSIRVSNVVNLVIARNTIRGGPHRYALELMKRSTSVEITDNLIVGAGGDQGAVTLNWHSGLSPTDVLIQGNTIQASAGLSGVYGRDVERITVRDNEITGKGDRAGIQFINRSSTGKVYQDYLITENVVKNFASAVNFKAQTDKFKNVTIQDNHFSDDQARATMLVGILFEQTGPYSSFAVVHPNVFGAGIETPILYKP